MDANIKSNVTYEQFEACAREFVALSDKIGDGWELRSSRTSTETVFLAKNCTRVLASDQALTEDDGAQCLEEAASIEESDPAVLQCTDSSTSISQPLSNELVMSKGGQSTPTVHLEYHIVYSISYEVPVLYLNASYSNGRQLPLEDTWRLISERFTTTETDKWGLLTQQEHPLLSRPFYYIHPCYTARVMGQATSLRREGESHSADVSCDKHTSSGNYLVTWLSMFGALVGLKVPLGYCI